MFQATRMLFIYVETPLHAGTGRSLGVVDLPIQRERTSGYPMVQASSVKGRLRAEVELRTGNGITTDEIRAIFGPETTNASAHAGALSVGDARLLLLPVRSVAGVFAWVTSVDALARFRRDATALGLSLGWELPPEPDTGETWVNGDSLKAGDSVVLEEFSFTPRDEQARTIEAIGTWLAENALPRHASGNDEYDYWRDALPKKLCVLPENDFRDFALYGTEVQTHVRLDPNTKTVQRGALWTAESLPADTLLYAPLMATRSRSSEVDLTAEEILQKVSDLDLTRTRLGGDETTGQGVVALRFTGGAK